MGCEESLHRYILFKTFSWCSQGCFCICLMYQDIRAGVCRGGHCDKGQVLPFARHSLSQLAPMDLLQGTAEPVRWSGGDSVEKCLKSVENTCNHPERQEQWKCERKKPFRHLDQRTRKIKYAAGAGVEIPLQSLDYSDAGCFPVACGESIQEEVIWLEL